MILLYLKRRLYWPLYESIGYYLTSEDAVRANDLGLLRWLLEVRWHSHLQLKSLFDMATDLGHVLQLKHILEYVAQHKLHVQLWVLNLNQAVKFNRLTTVKWLIKLYHQNQPIQLYLTRDILAYASSEEMLRVLLPIITPNIAIILKAAQLGNRFLIRYLSYSEYANLVEGRLLLCHSCESGSLDLVQLVWELLSKSPSNDCHLGCTHCCCRISKQFCNSGIHNWCTLPSYVKKSLRMAATKGWDHILKWFDSQICFQRYKTTFAVPAAMNNHCELALWLDPQRKFRPLLSSMVLASVEQDDLESFLRLTNQEDHLNFVLQAASNGSLKIMEYLVPRLSDALLAVVTETAAIEGHLDMLKLIHRIKGSVELLVLNSCAYFRCTDLNINRFEMLQWLDRTPGVEVDLNWWECFLHAALMNGHFGLIQWMDNAFELELNMGYHFKRSSVQLIKYLHQRGAQLSQETLTCAVRQNDLPLVQWLLKKNIKPNCTALSIAKLEEYYEVLQVLEQNARSGLLC